MQNSTMKMNGILVFSWISCGVLAGVAEAATYFLKAVKVNGSAITATDHVLAEPGDWLTIELFASGWAPKQLKIYQAKIDSEGYANGVGGDLQPRLYPCTTDDDCTTAFGTGPYCDTIFHPGFCESGFINATRADFVFAPPTQSVPSVDISSLCFRYGAIVLSNAVTDTGTARYAGTLLLDVPANASGDYVIDLMIFDPNTQTIPTFMQDSQGYIEPITTSPLHIEVAGACPPAAVVSTNPPHCAIDARQPSALDGANLQGFKVLTFTFNDECVVEGVSEKDFSVREVPSGGGVPFASIATNGAVVTVTLSAPIDPGKWTCIEHISSGIEKCWGSLPADASGDRNATAGDIITLINHLNNVGTPLPIEQCDMDRSGGCGAPDIIRLIDLLNGASAFDPWLGTSLPSCPAP